MSQPAASLTWSMGANDETVASFPTYASLTETAQQRLAIQTWHARRLGDELIAAG